MEKEDGVWRTIRGRRIFIASGESLGQAMAKSGKFSRDDIRVGKHQAKHENLEKKFLFTKRKGKTKKEQDLDFQNKGQKYRAEWSKDYPSYNEPNRQAPKNRINENAETQKFWQKRTLRNYDKYSETDKREIAHENLQKKLADYKAKKQSNNKIETIKGKQNGDIWNAKEKKNYIHVNGKDYEIDTDLLNSKQIYNGDDVVLKVKDGKVVDYSKQSNNKVNSSKMSDEDVEKEVAMSTFGMFGAREVNYNGEKIKLDNNITNEQSNEKKWEVKSTGGFGQQYGEGNIPIRDGHVDYESHFGAFAQDLTLLSDKELKTAIETQQKMFDKYSSRPKNYDARTRNGRALKIMQDSELANARLSVEALKKEVVRRENEKHPQYKGTDYEVKYASVKDAINDPNSKINQYIAKKRSNKNK